MLILLAIFWFGWGYSLWLYGLIKRPHYEDEDIFFLLGCLGVALVFGPYLIPIAKVVAKYEKSNLR